MRGSHLLEFFLHPRRAPASSANHTLDAFPVVTRRIARRTAGSGFEGRATPGAEIRLEGSILGKAGRVGLEEGVEGGDDGIFTSVVWSAIRMKS